MYLLHEMLGAFVMVCQQCWDVMMLGECWGPLSCRVFFPRHVPNILQIPKCWDALSGPLIFHLDESLKAKCDFYIHVIREG